MTQDAEHGLTTLTEVDKMIQALPSINTIPDARKLLALAQGYVISAHKLYKATELTTINDANDDKSKSHDIASKAAELRLYAEARLGEIIKSEQALGRLATSNSGGHVKGRNVATLHDYNLTKSDSSRAQDLAEHKDIIAKVIVDSIDIPTRHAVLKEIKNTEQEISRQDKVSKPLPGGVFNVFYADPAWKYDNSGFAMSANKHYEVMELEDIKALPISDHVAKDAVLFLWATNPMLRDALAVIEAWGFEYKTNMVWVKDKFTAGFYVRGKHELLLIATRGSLLPSGNLPVSIINGKSKDHSRKPGETHEIIESMFPESTKCELFARNTRPGWESWGNEL